jgi:hypothetical protein
MKDEYEMDESMIYRNLWDYVGYGVYLSTLYGILEGMLNTEFYFRGKLSILWHYDML